MIMNHLQICISFVIVSILFTCVDLRNSDEENRQDESSEINKPVAVDLYRRLLRQKRNEQLAALKGLMSIESYEKQYKLVKLLIEKISVVLSENKLKLLDLGYMPGDAFPEDEKLKEVLSMVVENTLFAGEILLRLPDMTSDLLKRNKEWDLLIKWAVSYVNETHILVKPEETLLSLMGQELDVIPKSQDYVNPFRQQNEISKDKIQKELEEAMKKMDEKQKKKKKEKQRGPRLQGGRNEL